MKNSPTIVQDPDNEIGPEVLATAITELASSTRCLLASRLTRKAIVVLIQNQSKLPMKTIEIVLNNVEQLDKDWLK